MSKKFPVVDEFFPSLVPPFRVLVSLLAECQECGTPFDCVATELHQSDAVLSAFVAGFRFSMRGFDYDEKQAKVVARIYVAFEYLGGMMSSLYATVGGNNVEGAVRDVEAIAAQLRIVEEGVAQIKELETAKPRLSTVPGIDVLLRSGRAIIDGRRNWSILATRLEALRPLAEKMAAQDGHSPALEEHIAALNDLFKACAEENLAALPETLERVKSTGELVMTTQQHEQESLHKPPVSYLCPRCGASMSGYDRSCPVCRAKMPERFTDSSSTDHAVRSLDLPEYVQVLFRAAEGLRNRRDTWQEFNQAVAEVRRRATITLKTFENLPSLPAEAGQDEIDAAVFSKEAMSNGLAKFFQALDIFESMSPEQELDVAALDCGLEAVVGGVEETRQVNITIKRFLSNRQ